MHVLQLQWCIMLMNAARKGQVSQTEILRACRATPESRTWPYVWWSGAWHQTSGRTKTACSAWFDDVTDLLEDRLPVPVRTLGGRSYQVWPSCSWSFLYARPACRPIQYTMNREKKKIHKNKKHCSSSYCSCCFSYYAPDLRRQGEYYKWWSMSVRLSVACLDLTREQKGL